MGKNNKKKTSKGGAFGNADRSREQDQSQQGQGSSTSLPHRDGPPGASFRVSEGGPSVMEADSPDNLTSESTWFKKASKKDLDYWRDNKKDDKDYEDSAGDKELWDGSKLLENKIKERLKAVEDASLVKPNPKELEALDKAAKAEGKCLYRPNFVNSNSLSRVTLWANYFPVIFDEKKLSRFPTCYSYNLEVVRVDKKTKYTGRSEAQTENGAAGQDTKKNTTKDEVKPRLVKILLQKVLDAIIEVPDYTTDFKDNIIFLKKVTFESSDENVIFSGTSPEHTAQVHHSPPGAPNIVHIYHVQFRNKQQFNLNELENTLRCGGPKEAAQAAARLRDILAVVMGHILRVDRKVAVIGSGRFFKQDASQRVHVKKCSMLAILRGFSLNVRPATNRLLVNVNVTCSIFRPRINIGRWLRIWRWERQWDTNNNNKLEDLELLHKIISKTRILYKAPGKPKSSRIGEPPSTSPTWSDASEFRPLPQDEEFEFSIAGFARATDGCMRTCKTGKCCHCMRREEHRGQCTEECKAKKKLRGIVIDEDFPSAQKARFQCLDAASLGCEPKTLHNVAAFLAKGHVAYRFKYNDIPLINRGTSEEPEYIPAERCWIAFGQPVRTKLHEKDCEKLMIKFACRRPYRNAQAICEHGYKTLKLGSENPLLNRLGITVDKNLVTVDGHRLTPPALSYGGGQQKTVSNGAWNMTGCKVWKSCSSDKRWTWICLENEHSKKMEHIGDGIKEFQKQLKGMGMGMMLQEWPESERMVTLEENDSNKTLLELSKKLDTLKKKGVDLVLIVFPGRQPVTFYNKIKFLGDVVHGIHTSCLIESNFGDTVIVNDQNDNATEPNNAKRVWKVSPDYFANVALKVNLKLGGHNHELFEENPTRWQPGTSSLLGMPEIGSTMVVGYDVIHPTGPDTEDMQSQVGFVASVDIRELSQWQGCYWGQEARTEILDNNLQQAFKKTVLCWGRARGKRPDKIVIFRDGVSESQYETVLEKELGLIRKACEALADEEYKYELKRTEGGRSGPVPLGKKPSLWSPKITFVVSVKRHSTRFYPTDSISMNERTRNIKAGTVVDRSVTQARFWEFFLTAQDAIKGTARPTRYVVLHDEIFREKYKTLAASKLEEFTHNLSYMFGRATKAVRLCTPAYYADILCTRARAYESVLKDKRFIGGVEMQIATEYKDSLNATNDKLNENQIQEKVREDKYRVRAGENHPKIKESMFWV